MYQQLVTLQNLGGFKKLIEKMIPSRDIPDEVKSMAEGNMDRIQIIIQSCTPGERKNPDMIRKTRISRIAQGSGTSYTEVKQVLNQWEQMNNWMKKMTNPKKRGKKRGSGMPGMEGMDAGAFPGGIPSGFDMSKMQQMMTQGGKVKRKKHPW